MINIIQNIYGTSFIWERTMFSAHIFDVKIGQNLNKQLGTSHTYALENWYPINVASIKEVYDIIIKNYYFNKEINIILERKLINYNILFWKDFLNNNLIMLIEPIDLNDIIKIKLILQYKNNEET